MITSNRMTYTLAFLSLFSIGISFETLSSNLSPNKDLSSKLIGKASSCPQGFSPGIFTNLCIDGNIGSQDVSTKLQDGTCVNPNQVTLNGLSYCFKSGLHINAYSNKILLSKPHDSECVANYRISGDKSYCRGSELGLKLVNEQIQLVAQVEPKNNSTGSSVSKSGYGCYTGYTFLASQDGCVEYSLLEIADITVYGLTPLASCEVYWTRANENQLCRPRLNLHRCGYSWPCNEYNGDSLIISTKPLTCGGSNRIGHLTVPTVEPLQAVVEFDPSEPMLAVSMGVCAPPGRFFEPLNNY